MPAAIDKELLDLEKQYWEAMQNRDGATATRLSDARCVVVGPQGIGKLDRQALAGLVENPPYELKEWRFDDEVHVQHDRRRRRADRLQGERGDDHRRQDHHARGFRLERLGAPRRRLGLRRAHRDARG